ncbi:MAG: CYCXC family (seleno)protein [Acidobacteriaceae bacterium]|nr:CYCXC family (seleno)protein [Acidobacteriaceae bacterium]
MKKILSAVGVLALSLAASAQFSNPAMDIPAYNAQAPSRPIPPIRTDLTGPYFAHSYQVTAYKMAQKVPNVLYQQPCYCRCDRGMGHKSLHSCFEGLHGAECSTCMKEAAYSYKETKLGKSAAQVRAGIERGEYESIDLEHLSL